MAFVGFVERRGDGDVIIAWVLSSYCALTKPTILVHIRNVLYYCFCIIWFLWLFSMKEYSIGFQHHVTCKLLIAITYSPLIDGPHIVYIYIIIWWGPSVGLLRNLSSSGIPLLGVICLSEHNNTNKKDIVQHCFTRKPKQSFHDHSIHPIPVTLGVFLSVFAVVDYNRDTKPIEIWSL